LNIGGANVGIGTTAPEGKLHIAQSTNNIYGLDAYHTGTNTTSTAHIIWTNQSGNTKPTLRVHEEGTRSNLDTDVFLVTGTSSNTDLFHIRANGNATFSGTVKSTGNMGIGADPQSGDRVLFANGGADTYIKLTCNSRTVSFGVESVNDFVIYSDSNNAYSMKIDASRNATFTGYIYDDGGFVQIDKDRGEGNSGSTGTNAFVNLHSHGGSTNNNNTDAQVGFYVNNAKKWGIGMSGQSGHSALTDFNLYNVTTDATAVNFDASSNAIFAGYVYATNGVYIMALNGDNQIRVGQTGGGSTALAIGNRTITVYDASDERKKDIIGETERGLSDILKWSIKDFTWKPEWDRDSTTINTGAIAQELIKVNPELVNKHEIEDENGEMQDGVWGIEYIKTIPYLIKAVQELSAKVTALENA
jgi:hypothetical protein